MNQQPQPTRWIESPAWDLAFFFGSGLVAAAIAALVLLLPSCVVPLWIAWLLLLDGPHLFLTYTRTYLDPAERARRPRLLAGSLGWFAPGLAAWAVSEATGNGGPFVLFLGFAGLWSIHHAVRQNYGLLSIYQRLSGATRAAQRTDSSFLYALSWGSFLVYLLALPVNRRLLGLSGEPPAGLAVVVRALAAVLVVACLLWVVIAVSRVRTGAPIRPFLFAIGPALGTWLVAYFVVGPSEPIASKIEAPEHLVMGATLVAGIVHSLQYVGIVLAKNRVRFATSPVSFSSRIGKWPLAGYAVALASSVAYFAINSGRGVFFGASPQPEASTWGRFFLAIYWGLFLHHFYLDQRIWRVGTDVTLRRELGLASP